MYNIVNTKIGGGTMGPPGPHVVSPLTAAYMNCSVLSLHLLYRGFYNGRKIVSGLSSWKARKIIAPQRKILNGSPMRKTTRCYCLNALANVDAAAATSEWVPFIDQVLLLATIILTCMSHHSLTSI